MRLIRKSIILLVLLLATMALVPCVTATADSHAVGVEEARTVAETNAQRIATTSPEFSDWKGADVREATIYYDLTGNRSAYSFEVTAGGTYAGYLIVSATRENFPVLEYSRGETPDRNAAMKARADQLAAKEAGAKKVSIEIGRPLYLGATFFYMEYPVDRSGLREASKERILIDLYEDRVVTPEPINTALDRFKTNITEFQRFQHWKKQEVEAAWTAVNKNGLQTVGQTDVVENSVATTLDEIKTISDVPYYRALHPDDGGYGCSPAAASMVLGYWRNRGLTRLPPPMNQTTGDNLTSELAIAMGTNMETGSTFPLDISVGMNNVMVENYGYSYGSVYELTDYPEPNVQNEINSDRPFVLSMLLGHAPEEGGLAYGQHSVAAVGYTHISGSPEYITLHDGWATTDRHIVSGGWAAALNTYERPEFTYTITANAGSHGSIYPSGSVQVPRETGKTFTISPDLGYAIVDVTVDDQSIGTGISYTFADVTASHTISATFGQNVARWDWAQSGWGNWLCVPDDMGYSTPYGPVIVNNSVEGLHGEYGLDLPYHGWGYTDVMKTFTDPTNTGWNTITLCGSLPPVSDPDDTYFYIFVNNVTAFGSYTTRIPPGNDGEPFIVTAHFPQSSTAYVQIELYPEWAIIPERVALHYDSLSLSRQEESLMQAGNSTFTITDGKGTTRSGFVTTGNDGIITITDSTGRTWNARLPDSKNRSIAGAVRPSDA